MPGRNRGRSLGTGAKPEIGNRRKRPKIMLLSFIRFEAHFWVEHFFPDSFSRLSVHFQIVDQVKNRFVIFAHRRRIITEHDFQFGLPFRIKHEFGMFPSFWILFMPSVQRFHPFPSDPNDINPIADNRSKPAEGKIFPPGIRAGINPKSNSLRSYDRRPIFL